MENAIIDKDKGLAMEYRKLIKNPKHIPGSVKYFTNEIDHQAKGFGEIMDATNTFF